MVILGLVVDAALVPGLTRDFLALKRRHFPGRFTAGHALDHVLVEVKGNEILQMTRSLPVTYVDRRNACEGSS
jgi:hypothetical protein